MSNVENLRDIPSNEDIVNDILNSATDNLSVNDNNDSVINTGSTAENVSINDNGNASPPADFDQCDPEKEESIVPDDFIDEEKLKDLEVELTEDEKSERHQKALEYKQKGNEDFKNQKYLEAVQLYTEGLRICPLTFGNDRAILYANRAASKVKLDRKSSAIDDCSKAIELNNKYIRAYLRRAVLYEETEKLDESLEDYKKVFQLDPGNKDATAAQIRLPPLINERNEKLKTEMLGKLKDLGNVILRPFGLSTDNFQLTQDPNSGGYSVNFTQNPR
ncbi:tetratricopeptide repeat domain 1 [Rhynchophorus ferrugineus]|uniref:Tetratricopeptide repeat protein 1 n=1 Tax=Rhynchophorus ferrugineus TaxID=354439 RepID=A0A834IL12_RHYFE|nr:hypothetical protein GWI33_006079 [Rhynchophorus ferrugineus]